MDVVYRYRKNGDGETLRYSLRSLKNFPHDKVWIFGDSHPWFKELNHVFVRQDQNSKWANSRKNVLAACNNNDVSEDFVLMDDDFFIMQSIVDIPVNHRGLIESHEEAYRSVRSAYAAGLVATKRIMMEADLSQPFYSYELHIPMVVNKDKMVRCMRHLRSLSPVLPRSFQLRSWYGNYWNIGGTELVDVKVHPASRVGHCRDIPDGPFMSTSEQAFYYRGSQARHHIMKTFSEPSPYETGRSIR